MTHVHIVAYEWQSDQILARMVQHLVNGLGYTVSGQPDVKADINYFFPYILYAQQFLDWHETPVAAYFSHHDTVSKEKDEWWKAAAQAVDLRLVTAHKYGHEVKAYGDTAYVHAPVDLDHFVLRDRRAPHAPPQIGLSGYIYGDGRKGERLLPMLLKTIKNRANFVATGRGWSIPTQHHDWRNLPTFYQNLDLFLCASIIEGVPMPPLEALATGVPIIIPYRVGMLDELPEHPDIYRFVAGDVESMARAVLEALERPYAQQPDDLRQIASEWSVSAWVDDHARAFERLISPPFPEETLPDFKGNSGVVYVAYGNPARECARDAINSFKRFMPGVPVCLVSDEPLNGGEDVFAYFPKRDIGGRAAKIKIFDLVPEAWEYVLYLDADTEIIADISFLYKLLEGGWEFIICKNPQRYHSTKHMHRPDNLDEVNATFNVLGYEDFIQWNGGVFGWRRNARVQAFFAKWFEEWEVYRKRDQAALLRAMWANPLRMLVLGNEFNTITRYNDPETSAGILHYPTTARQWTGVINGPLDGAEAWSKVNR